MALIELRPAGLEGLFELVPQPQRDERGAFVRTWSAQAFAEAGIDFRPLIAAISQNTEAFTLRGLHWQEGAAAEAKLVRCAQGQVLDVAVDLREHSATRWQHRAVVLDARQGNALFIPRGFAHGYLTLTGHAVVDYLLDAPHVPELARGLRWDDPRLAIPWPGVPRVISARDQGWPLLDG